MKKKSQMRFGLIGAGGIGEVRAKAINKLDNCQLLAVADREKERARNAAPSHDTKIFDDYQELLALEEVDAIIVSTPPPFHEEMAVSALKAGKHVLCEKPLANSVEACRRMVETAKRTNKILATGFNHRYFPAIQFVKQTLESGLIGELDHVRAFSGHTGLSEFAAPWMYDKKSVGGGALMDNGIHIIDLTRYLLGEIVEVYGIATCNVWKLNSSEDNGIALMRNSQGKHAILHATWTEWKGYRFHIEAYGDRGMVRAFYAPMMTMVIYVNGNGERRRRKFNLYPMNFLQEKLYGWQSSTEKTFQREITDFIKMCHGQNGIIADGFAGFRSVEIANAIYRSSAQNQVIRLVEPF